MKPHNAPAPSSFPTATASPLGRAVCPPRSLRSRRPKTGQETGMSRAWPMLSPRLPPPSSEPRLAARARCRWIAGGACSTPGVMKCVQEGGDPRTVARGSVAGSRQASGAVQGQGRGAGAQQRGRRRPLPLLGKEGGRPLRRSSAAQRSSIPCHRLASHTGPAEQPFLALQRHLFVCLRDAAQEPLVPCVQGLEAQGHDGPWEPVKPPIARTKTRAW